DNECNGADNLEIEKCITSSLSHLLHVFHAGDADHDRAEDDRRNNHLDQLDEAVAQGFHRRACLGIEVSEQDTNYDGDDDLEIERFVKWLACRSHLHPPQSILRNCGTSEPVTRRRPPAPGGQRDNWTERADRMPRA